MTFLLSLMHFAKYEKLKLVLSWRNHSNVQVLGTTESVVSIAQAVSTA